MSSADMPEPSRPSESRDNLVAFLFGAGVYFAFWVLLIYLLCFVANFFDVLRNHTWADALPLKSIDTGVLEPGGKAVIIDIALIVIFGLQHSIMARPWFKNFITRKVPPHLERSTYIVFAIAVLALLIWQWRPIPYPLWDVENTTLRGVLYVIQFAGWVTLLVATFQVGHWRIFGVTQALDYIRRKPDAPSEFVARLPNEFFKNGWPIADKGLWYFSRHPDFFGFCVAFWVTPTMTVGHLLFAAGLTLYILLGISLLETNLKELYGAPYEQYVRLRSKIIPWWVNGKAKTRIVYRVVGAAAILIIFIALGGAILIGALLGNAPQPGTVEDEAALAKRDVATFPAADEDYFHAMDNGAQFSPDQVKGRNMWIVWTGGNDRFWDVITKNTLGTFDLLKIISSHPSLKYSHNNRWAWLGVVNEPCFERPTGPDPNRFGLWLDKRRADCPEDPFASEKKYPGVKVGARADGSMPPGSYYGEPTGIVGLRLFPNPDFDAAARKKWDAERYYADPSYYLRSDIVRPYRVGMACGFCHVGPSPINPPKDPEHPAWENLNSTVGAQYLWLDRVFVWSADESNVVFQLVHAYQPGTFDTSLVSSDNILNPRTMNAVYNLGDRLELARQFDPELLVGGQLDNKQFNDFPNTGSLRSLYQRPYSWTPRVLKDGSDSVGALGALNRVYMNIGLFSEEWLLHFFPFMAVKRLSPIPIATAERNSVYWRATEQQTNYMAQFLVAAGKPDYLAAAPGGKQYLTAAAATLDRGKTIFAERCARCHSSKLPEPIEGMTGPQSCTGANYLNCWNRYWAWTKTGDFKKRMTDIVKAPDFLDKNYLSTDLRVPTTLLQINACSPLATNAIAGDIWDNFSSQSYKDLPTVGDITIKDPFNGEPRVYRMPAGGRGYIRPPSLISLWSTAPYLQNNIVGKFDPDPSVAARMRGFTKGIDAMLWPDLRDRDVALGDRGVGLIQRTTKTSWVLVPAGFLPRFVIKSRSIVNWFFPGAMNEAGDLRLGPIPRDTPIDFIGNFNPLPDGTGLWADITKGWGLLKLLLRFQHYASSLPANASNEQAQTLFEPVARQFHALSKCQDYEVNRGHYFGTDLFAEEPGLSDADKNALIEFLKTF
jgi:protein-S-isoprenylcysteine O-methyltransferase Ste14